MATDRHQAPSYPLRMPDELKSKVAESAEVCGRSLHAEILIRLEESFRLNKLDADVMQAEMRLAEARLREAKAMQRVLHLAKWADLLLRILRDLGAASELERVAGFIKMVEGAIEEAKVYERELNPRMRLREFEEAIQRSEAVLEFWRPTELPWPGSPEVDKEPPPKRIRRTPPKPKSKPGTGTP